MGARAVGWRRTSWSRKKAKLIFPIISYHNGMQKAQPIPVIHGLIDLSVTSAVKYSGVNSDCIDPSGPSHQRQY